MEFLEAAANWADRRSVDVKFFRDEYDGWTALLMFTDSKGPYSASVSAVPRAVGKEKETPEEYQARIDRRLSREASKAHERRIGKAVRYAAAA